MNMLRKMMYGRYGGDQLSLFLMVLYLALHLLTAFIHLAPLRWIATVLLVLAFYRLMSRQIERRRAENAQFMAYAGPVLAWLKLRRTIWKDRDHRYFKCPNCGQSLRVPKGKGKVTITCRSCGVSFEEKS